MKKIAPLILSLALLTACSFAGQVSAPSDTSQKPASEPPSKNNNSQPNNTTPPPQDKTQQGNQHQSGSGQAADPNPGGSSQPKNDKRILIEIKDESSKDPSLVAFLDRLNITVKNKDKEALIAMLDENVKVSFGGDSGKQDFITYWKLGNEPKKSDVWRELADMLALGGNFSRHNSSAYSIPYLFENFPEVDDPFRYAAIIGKNVNLRAKPTQNAATVTQLSYELVKVDPPLSSPTVTIDGVRYHWIPVATLGGRKGYVAEKYVRSSVDYRLNLQKNQGGEWKIIFFVNGD